MKRVWKKMAALLMMLAMVFGISTLAEADAATTTSAGSLETHTLYSVTNVVSNTVTVTIDKIDTSADAVSFSSYQVIYATYDSSSNALEWHLTEWAFIALVTNGSYTNESAALEAVIAATAIGSSASTNGESATEQSAVVNALAAYIASVAGTTSKVSTYASLDTTASEFATTTAGDTSTTATLAVGTYLVIPVCDNMSFLNMMVSVDVSATSGTTDSSWQLASKDAVLKGKVIDIEKSVTDASAQVGEGDTVEYTLTVDVPQFAENDGKHEFEVVDVATHLMIDRDNVTIKGYTSSTDTTGTALAETTNYTVTVETTSTGSKMTVSFTNQYMTTFYSSGSYPYAYVTISYDAELLSSAVTTGNTNIATLTYVSDSQTNTASDTETVYTYQLTLTKYGTNSALLADAEFEAYYYDSSSVKQALTFVLNSDGTYEVADSTDTASGSSVTTYDVIKTGSNGTVTLIGLDADITYFIEETKAPSGYSLNTNILSFTISDTTAGTISTVTPYEYTSYTAGTTTTTDAISNGSWTAVRDDDSSVSINLSVTDTEISALPATGSIGIIVFTIAGVAIMILALVLINSGKSKQKKA